MRSIDEARRHGHPSMKGVQRAAPGHHSLPFRWPPPGLFVPVIPARYIAPVGLTRAELGTIPLNFIISHTSFFLPGGEIPPDP